MAIDLFTIFIMPWILPEGFPKSNAMYFSLTLWAYTLPINPAPQEVLTLIFRMFYRKDTYMLIKISIYIHIVSNFQPPG